MMDAQLKQEWIAALESDEFRQGRHQLKCGDRFCCLGVLCEIVRRKEPEKNQWDGGTFIPKDRHGFYFFAPAEYGVPVEIQHKLSLLNDQGRNFKEIAGVIREEVE